jgi:DNA polymerase III subunit beta
VDNSEIQTYTYMKFTCTRNNLLESLLVVNNIANLKTNLPILNNILITVTDEHVQLVSTNLELAVKTELQADIEMTGKITIPGKMLYDFINLMNDEQISFFQEGEELNISCNGSETKIKGLDAEDYPIIPSIEDGKAFTILANVFSHALSRTVVATSKTDIRPELSGVFMGFNQERYAGLILAATDSYRLAEKKMSIAQGDEAIQCIVPSRGAQEMIRLLSLVGSGQKENQVRMWVSENQISIRYNSFEFSSRLIEGTYPDYSQIIPKEFKTTSDISRDDFVKKIKAASLFTASGVNSILFSVDAEANSINIASSNTQAGQHASVSEAVVHGENNTISLNFRYILDGLGNMDSNDVHFFVNSPDSPCMIRTKGKEDYLYLIMPIRQ